MSIPSRVFGGAFVVLSSLLTLPAGAQVSDSGRLPPPPLPIPSSAAQAGSFPSAPPAQAPPVAQTPINTQDLSVVPGAGEDKRRALLGRIMEAKNQGIGISTYMMAFDALEQSAKGGETEENVSKRVASLNTSLDDQFKRSAILKVQRAAPPIAASSPSTPFGSSSGGASGNSDTAALIQKLQSKFGSQIPDLQSKYGSQIPDSLKDKIPSGGGDPSALLKNPEIQDLLKKYGK